MAQVVFVRNRLVEIQYLRTPISDEQREEFGHLVQDSIRRIEAAQFLPHRGIRFPQNPCASCPYIGTVSGTARSDRSGTGAAPRRFPESRRKAYYLMSIHEHLPPQARKDLKEL